MTDLSRGGATKIDKSDFLSAYPQARDSTFTRENIVKGFQAAGLLSVEKNRLISKLNIQLTIPTTSTTTTPLLSYAEDWELRTSEDHEELKKTDVSMMLFKLSFKSR